MGIQKYYNESTNQWEAIDSGAINDGTNKFTPTDVKDIDTKVKSLSKVRTVEEFVATEGQTVFNLNGEYSVGKDLIEVVVGGVPQSESAYEESSPTSITLSEGVPSGTNVKIVRYEAYIPTSENHKSIHYVGGQDELDVTRLKNYTENIQDRFTDVTSQLAQNMTFITNQFQQKNNTKFIAHRGASQVAPENTIPALIAAGKAGFEMVEFDVLPTADGVWVLNHDDTIDRMTNGSGNVKDLTFSQIQSYNIDNGANFGLYPNLKIPTLENALITCRNYNLIPFIELKGDTTSENYDSLITLIRKYGFETKSIIISAYPDALTKIRNRNKLIYMLYVTNAIYENASFNTFDFTKGLGNSGISLEHTIASKELIDRCHDLNLKVNVWTVNDYAIAKTMIDRGADTITSDMIVKVRWV